MIIITKIVGWFFTACGIIAIMFSPITFGVAIGVGLVVIGCVMIQDW